MQTLNQPFGEKDNKTIDNHEKIAQNMLCTGAPKCHSTRYHCPI